MHHKHTILGLVAAGMLLVALAVIWLTPATPANAQCGSQASSCKACHEVQGALPVNGDGTAWHTSHAFGDFCYICHAGNNQAKGEAEAHAGMVPPLSDVKASCQQCHPADLQERAQVYAATLGVEIGTASALASAASPGGSEPGSAPAESSPPATGDPPTSGSAPVTTEIDLDDPNLVDYSIRYREIVLGEKPVNWGNLILLTMIGLVAVGGGGFVAQRERLVRFSFGDMRKVEPKYPADVLELLPDLANLKVKSRKTLKSVLNNPQKAEKLLDLMQAVVMDEESEA